MIVFGDTNGPLFRERSESSTRDFFVMEFDMNGSHKRHSEAPIGAAPAPTPAMVQSVYLTPVAAPASAIESRRINNGVLIGILVPVILIMVVAIAYFLHRQLGCCRSKKTIGDDVTAGDGIIASNKKAFSNPPPHSLFHKGKLYQGGDGDPLGGYSDNLKGNGNDIGKNIV